MSHHIHHRVRRLSVRAIALVAGATLVATACGGGDSDFDSLDPATQNLVLFESGWQCEVGRFAVDEPGDLEQLRADRQLEHEITDGAYQAFLAQIADGGDLARIVSERTQSCLDADEPVQL